MNEDILVNQNCTVPPVQPVNYSKTDTLLAYSCIVLGYLFIKLVFVGSLGIATTIYFLLFCVLAYLYFVINETKLNSSSIIQLILINIFNMSFLLSSNMMIKFLNLIFIIFAIIYWCYTSCYKNRKEIVQPNFIFELIKAIFVLPFSSFADCSKAIGNSINKNKSGKHITKILLGLCLALPVTLIVGGLLLSADTLFEHMLTSVFSNITDEIMTLIIQILFGIPIAFYLFGMLFSNIKQKHQGLFKNEACVKINNSMKVISPSVLYTAATPICVLYALFFFAQSAYFLSAFQSYLPQNFSYAEYARKGFFELCAISVINLGIIIFMNSLCKHKNEKAPTGLKVYTIVISVFTILLIATAISKMVMYIENYGLTLLRVYTSWFMILLCAIFILVMIKALFANMNILKSCAVCFIVLFAILTFSNVDGLIAKYNVEWYQNDRLEEVDISMMYQLSDSAVRYVLPLTKSADEKIAKEANEYILSFQENYKYHTGMSFNLSSYHALQAVENFQSAKN